MKHPENSSEYKGLTVNAGVENLPSVNPYATFRRRKQVLSADEYVAGILRGDMRLLSQAVTLIESNQVQANPPSLRHSAPSFVTWANTSPYWPSTHLQSEAKVVS